MKFSHITIATLILVISVVFGLAEYMLYQEQQEVKQLCAELSQKMYVLQEHQQIAQSTAQSMQNQSADCQQIITTATSAQLWANLQKEVQNTVVQLFVQKANFHWLEPYKVPEMVASFGSGFFISDNGKIITNAHVVNQSMVIHIQIPAFGKHQFEVDLVGIMPEKDFALLQLKSDDVALIRKALGKVPYLKLGDSDVIRRGDEVMALGYPLGQQSLKSTTGVISGRESGVIQMSAPINPGSSGGPSINTQGQVVGINAAGIREAQNVGYIIQINDLKVFLKELETEKLVRKPYLGILQSMATEDLVKSLGNPLPGGVYVVEVLADSPLKGKLEPGDMIYELNGMKVDLYGEMAVPWSEDKISTAEYIARLQVGQKVSFVVYRKGVRKTFSCDFERKKLAPIRQMYPGYELIDFENFGGFVIMPLSLNHIPLLLPLSSNLAKYVEDRNQTDPVLIITHVMPYSPAQRCRLLLSGSIVKQVNGKPVKTLEELRQAIAQTGDILTLQTSENAMVAVSKKDLVDNEMRLARMYGYQICPGMQALIQKEIQKQNNEAQAQSDATKK